jgi:hypothetical protein
MLKSHLPCVYSSSLRCPYPLSTAYCIVMLTTTAMHPLRSPALCVLLVTQVPVLLAYCLLYRNVNNNSNIYTSQLIRLIIPMCRTAPRLSRASTPTITNDKTITNRAYLPCVFSSSLRCPYSLRTAYCVVIEQQQCIHCAHLPCVHSSSLRCPYSLRTAYCIAMLAITALYTKANLSS